MAVGFPLKTTYANGDVYSASDVNDTNGTINLLGSSVAYAAGKNKIINGDFNIWQRGTSIALAAGTAVYGADRFRATGNGNFSRQTFTPGTAPVAGYEGQYFARWNLTSNSQNYDFGQRIENARTFAGQTVTFSFWAKASATTSNAFFPRIFQNFGTGGSPSSAVYTDGSNINLTTSWTRYTVTLAIPSVSGKTFGTENNSYLGVILQCNTTSVVDLDFWGWQLEQGSTATAFQTQSGSLGGELALCQRYYWRITGAESSNALISTGMALSTSLFDAFVNFPVAMRTTPTVTDYSGTRIVIVTGSVSQVLTPSAVTVQSANSGFTRALIEWTKAGSFTSGDDGWFSLAGASDYFGLGAEL